MTDYKGKKAAVQRSGFGCCRAAFRKNKSLDYSRQNNSAAKSLMDKNIV